MGLAEAMIYRPALAAIGNALPTPQTRWSTFRQRPGGLTVGVSIDHKPLEEDDQLVVLRQPQHCSTEKAAMVNMAMHRWRRGCS